MTGPISPGRLADAIERATAYAEAMSTQCAVPGGQIVVVGRDGVLAERCWGSADLAGGVAVRPDHRFEIGSISKVVTAIVVHQLVDEGLLDLDRPVTEVLPWLDLGRPAAVITPRHLLSHTAGFVLGADHVPDEVAQVWGMRELARAGEPGEAFHYSNLGFMVLGRLASHVTGRAFGDLVRERVLEPLGMGGARPDIRDDDRPSMAVGHWPLRDDRPWVPGDPLVPATWFEISSADGNVVSTARELGELARFLLGDGVHDGARLLSAESMTALVSYAAPSGDGVPVWNGSPQSDFARYGLGINVEDVGGHHCVTHGGGMVGYACYLLSDRDAGLGVVVLTDATGDHPASHAIAYVAHAQLVAAVEGRPLPPVPSASAAVRPDELDPALLGTFTAVAPAGSGGAVVAAAVCDGGGESLTLEVGAAADGGVEVVTRAEGGAIVRGRLLRTWSSRLATDHLGLRVYPWTATDDGWAVGPWVLRRSAAADPSADADVATAAPAALDPRLAAYVGRYRSWSPWFATFRIVAREGRLVLIAATGVEAPLEDMELVELEPDVFRVGTDPLLPERVSGGPLVNGQRISVTRDGLVYSRSFTG